MGRSCVWPTLDLQDKADLEQGRADLEEGRDTPCPLALDSLHANSNGRGDDLADEVGRVEKRRHDGTLLGVSKLSDQRGPRDNGEDDSKAQNHAGDDVHADWGVCHVSRGTLFAVGRRWAGKAESYHAARRPARPRRRP